MNEAERYVKENLAALADEEYRLFQIKLVPNIDKSRIMGVRVPKVRGFAKEFFKDPMAKDFIAVLPHSTYDENNLHAFLIEQIKDYDECVKELDRFLPYVDNWATCDSMRPKVFGKNKEKLLCDIGRWLKSEHTYTLRFGIEMLMNFYLDGDFKIEQAAAVAGVKNEDYYVKMMVAWYFATALAKHYGEILPFIEQRKLETWIHNKTIQKAIESYRITDEQKEYLRSLKIK